MVACHGCTIVYSVFKRSDILNFPGIIRPVFQKVRASKGEGIARKGMLCKVFSCGTKIYSFIQNKLLCRYFSSTLTAKP